MTGSTLTEVVVPTVTVAEFVTVVDATGETMQLQAELMRLASNGLSAVGCCCWVDRLRWYIVSVPAVKVSELRIICVSKGKCGKR